MQQKSHFSGERNCSISPKNNLAMQCNEQCHVEAKSEFRVTSIVVTSLISAVSWMRASLVRRSWFCWRACDSDARRPGSEAMLAAAGDADINDESISNAAFKRSFSLTNVCITPCRQLCTAHTKRTASINLRDVGSTG